MDQEHVESASGRTGCSLQFRPHRGCRMQGERRTFRLRVRGAGAFEKTGHIEELAHDGEISRCRIIMRGLPSGFEPGDLEEVVLLDARTSSGELVAETFRTAGPIERGNSLLLNASFRPLGFRFQPPSVVRNLRTTCLLNAILNVVVLAVLTAWPLAKKMLEEQLWILSEGSLDLTPTRKDWLLASSALMASALPVIGYVLAMEAIAQRKHDWLVGAVILLLFSWASPIVLPILLVMIFSPAFKTYMTERRTVLNG